MIQGPFYYRLVPGTHMTEGLKASAVLTFLPEQQHQPSTTTLGPLLCQIYCTFQGIVTRDQVPVAAESSQFCCQAEICLSAIPLWPSVTSYPPPWDTAERNIPLCPTEILPGTNGIQVRSSSPEAPGSLLTALGHLLGSSMPCAVRESALPAPAAHSQSKCTACPL